MIGVRSRMTSFAVTLPGSHHEGETSSAFRSARTEAGRRRPASCQPCSHRRAARRDARQVMTCMSSTPSLCKFLQGICAKDSDLSTVPVHRCSHQAAANQPREDRNEVEQWLFVGHGAMARLTVLTTLTVHPHNAWQRIRTMDGALALGRAAAAYSPHCLRTTEFTSD